MKVGSLLIDMAADVARLRTDMTRATGIVDSAVSKMQSTVDGLKKGIAGLAAGLTVGAFSAAIKNQLDIADAMGKTAERTGLAVKDVAGLKLAFDMSGVSSDKLETSLGKMAKNMAEGSKAFGAMGVQIKNADGTLRSTRDVLGDVADKFAGYRDGAEKTALAQELFGKSGTEMISVLNAGRAGLDEMDAQAKRLGLTLDEEATAKATQFNDTLTLLQAGGEGFTRQIAGRLAPTLASLAGELLGNVNQSESLNTISNVLSATLKGLYSAGAIGAQIFANLGRAVGAGAAAIMAVLRGDFAGAKDIMNDVASVNAANWKSQLESLGRLWDDTGAKGVQAMAGVSAASRSAAPTVASVGAAAKQAKDEFADLLNKLNAKDSGVDADYFKNLNILFAGFQKGRIGLGEYRAAVEQLTQSQQFAKDIQKQLIEVAKEHTAGVDAAIKADEDALLKNEASIKTAREMLEQIQFETRALKMTNVERAKAMALRDLERQGIEAGTQAYEAYAEAILKALDEKAVTEASIEAQNQIREEWQKTTDQMGQSLADALMNGGKSVAEYLKGLFRNLVLRPIIQPIATSLVGGFMGMFGGPAMAGQGGGGSAGGLLNLGSSLFGAGGMTGSLMAGAGWLTGATTFGGALGAAGSLIGTGTAAGIGSGLAMGAGALAPILAPLALLGMSGAFSRKHEQHNLQGTFGGASGFEGNWHDYYKGGLFRSSKTVDTPLEADFLKGLQDAWKTQESAVQDYAETLGLATGKIDGFTYSINLKLKDIDAKDENAYQQAVMQRVSEAIRAGSNEMAQMLIGSWESVTETVARTVQTYGDEGGFGEIEETIERRTYKPSEFARDGEQAIDTLTRLATSLQGVNGMFDTLGLTLYEASLKGGDMASQLADVAGGLDKLQAASASYFQNFYTGSEQHATALRQVQEQMQQLGVETIPYTREQFRALVESLDLTTEAGRQMFAGLMAISEAFATVTPQLFQGGQTLSDAITQGLLGTFDGDNLGAYMAQTVTDGIYNAVAGQFAQQITDIIVSGVIDPVIQAAITGSSISAAVSQASIAEMVAQANAVAAAAAEILNDPAFQAAMASIGQAVGSIQIPAVRASSSVSTYTAAVRESGSAAESAASKIDSAWKSIGDSLMDEVNRIRGVMDESAGQGVDYWQAQFAIAKAQAMAGDQDAAKSLAGISQNLLRAGEESAGSMLELQRLRAQVAQSLQGVAGYAYGLAGIGVQQPTATPPVWTGTTSDGSPYAKPYSPPHTGPGAITNEPIEFMAWVAPPTYSAPSDSSNADVVAELRALRQAIETADRTDADLQRRTVRVLERFDTLGMPPARIEA